MARRGLTEIGAHTVTHPVLPGLPPSSQRDEIGRSKAALEEMLEMPIGAFSYPHGRYTSESIGLVQQTGFRCACAVRPHAGSPNLAADRPHPFLLPRVTVLDWDGDTFQQKLLHRF